MRRVRLPRAVAGPLLAVGVVVPLTGAFAGASLRAVDAPSSSDARAEGDATSTSRPTTTVSRSTTTTPAFRLPARPDRVEITSIMVVLREQKVYAYTTTRGRSRLVAIMPASTGLGDTTPTGRFQVFSQRARTFYNGNYAEKMDWMTRFTKGRQGDNIGFHGIPYTIDKNNRRVPYATPLGVRPSSHGCVRLADADARWIFRNITVKNASTGEPGTTVIVVRSRPS